MQQLPEIDPTHHQSVCRVLAEIRRWGIPVRTYTALEQVGLKRSEGLTESPAGRLGISYNNRYLWVDPCVPLTEALPFDLLHEMAHLVIGVSPWHTDEIKSGMLALEHEASQRLRLPGRSSWMKEYYVVPSTLGLDFTEDQSAWTFASRRVKSAALGVSQQAACKRGLMTQEGKPIYPDISKRAHDS